MLIHFKNVKSIPTNKHDFKLDYIFTERGIISKLIMNILILGDVMGPSGRKAIVEKLPKIN